MSVRAAIYNNHRREHNLNPTSRAPHRLPRLMSTPDMRKVPSFGVEHRHSRRPEDGIVRDCIIIASLKRTVVTGVGLLYVSNIGRPQKDSKSKERNWARNPGRRPL